MTCSNWAGWVLHCRKLYSLPTVRGGSQPRGQVALTPQILTSFLTACLVRRCVCVLWSQERCVVREVGRGGVRVHVHVVVWVCVSTSIKIKSLMTLACPHCTIIGYIRPNSLRAIRELKNSCKGITTQRPNVLHWLYCRRNFTTGCFVTRSHWITCNQILVAFGKSHLFSKININIICL